MDPVVPILIQAAASFGNSALGETAKRTVGLAWDSAVAAIKRRFGADHPAPALVDGLRNAAGNEVLTGVIRDKLTPLHLGHDADVLAAIERLAEVLKQQQPKAVGHLNVDTLQGAGQVFGTQNVYFGKDR